MKRFRSGVYRFRPSVCAFVCVFSPNHLFTSGYKTNKIFVQIFETKHVTCWNFCQAIRYGFINSFVAPVLLFLSSFSLGRSASAKYFRCHLSLNKCIYWDALTSNTVTSIHRIAKHWVNNNKYSDGFDGIPNLCET